MKRIKKSNTKRFLQIIVLVSFAISGCARANSVSKKTTNTNTLIEPNKSMENTKEEKNVNEGETEIATFGAGCFWCVEAQFQQLKGVKDVLPGYTGGFLKDPTYEQVGTGKTGHAEVANITFYPDSISYEQLLEAFFFAHDPTQLNRQGNDIGTQYRSSIFYHNDSQKAKVDYFIKRLNEEKAYSKPIVTVVEPYGVFYAAEDYHKNYYKLNPGNPYCQMVVKPKAESFKKAFSDLVRKEG